MVTATAERAPAAGVLEVLRAVFLRRCIAWALPRGGELVWPDDQAAVIALGVPCSDCGQVVYDLGAGERPHTLRVLMLLDSGRHWSDGISATCGGAA